MSTAIIATLTSEWLVFITNWRKSLFMIYISENFLLQSLHLNRFFLSCNREIFLDKYVTFLIWSVFTKFTLNGFFPSLTATISFFQVPVFRKKIVAKFIVFVIYFWEDFFYKVYIWMDYFSHVTRKYLLISM